MIIKARKSLPILQLKFLGLGRLIGQKARVGEGEESQSLTEIGEISSKASGLLTEPDDTRSCLMIMRGIEYSRLRRWSN